MALSMAEQTKREHAAVTLDPMPPRDRRIVHLALKDDPLITTRSTGDGFLRTVEIIPVGERREAAAHAAPPAWRRGGGGGGGSSGRGREREREPEPQRERELARSADRPAGWFQARTETNVLVHSLMRGKRASASLNRDVAAAPNTRLSRVRRRFGFRR